MKSVLVVDPPEGWKYGFPDILPENIEYVDFLKQKGYPEDKIELALMYSRTWFEDVEDDN